MPDASVRAVFFDVGGTLARPHLPMAELITQTARAAGLPMRPADQAVVAQRLDRELADRPRSGGAFTYTPERSRQHWTGLYRGCLEAVCSRHDAERIAAAVFAQLSAPAAYELYPDVMPALRTLSTAGLSLGIVSNWEAWLPALLMHLRISEYFDWIVASGAVEIEKPDPRIFEIALAASGFQAGEMIYVGDSVAHDVHGAAAVGMFPVLLDRSDLASGFSTVPVIRSLAELSLVVGYLQRAGGQATASASTSARLDAGSRSTR